jgi:hypothetical protein
MYDMIRVFPDRVANKWAFQWRDMFFWTNFPAKVPVDDVIKMVQEWNPTYTVTVR